MGDGAIPYHQEKLSCGWDADSMCTGEAELGVHSIVLYPCSRMQTKMGKQAKITNHAGT